MIRLLGVINSDKVNKQNVKFTVSSLESAYRDTWNTGVPSFLNHDHEKPIAWSTIAALHFEPGMVRTANLTYVPEKTEEVEIINTKIKEYYHDKVSNFISPYRDKLLNRVKTAVTENYKFNATESASIIDKDLALRIFPEIFETDDKNGLIDVSKLNPIAPGIFEHDGLLLYASPLFRRSFSRLNTLNTPFLRRFFELSIKPGLITRLALDKDMLGLPESLHEVFEFQYWWGPKFTDKLEDIPYGVTCHKSEEKHEFFTDIDRTEFWWHSQDGKQTFECEEVIQRPSLGISDSAYGCRYVHSMIDPSSNEPFHLDGAIRLYTEEKILNRWDVDISNSGKDTDYNKIWRLDGNINVSEWKELISHYYRDNMLVGEYLGGIDDKKDFKPELLEPESDKVPISEYVPCHMEKGEGVRISLSYKTKDKVEQSGRKIRATNSIFIKGVESRYIEADTLEIVKNLKKRGESIEMPRSGIELLYFEDMITNFPLILHRGVNAVESANVTLEVIREICESWSRRNHDRAITFNIGITYDTKNAIFSFAGHIEDILQWLAFQGSKFPTAETNCPDWCETAATFLSGSFPEANDKPRLGEMLKYTGLLYFERKFLDHNDFRLYFDEKNKAVMVELKLLLSQKDIVEEIEKGRLQVAPVYSADSTCSKCNENYKTCACSKTTEEDVIQNMENIHGKGIFWTKRKA